METGKTTWFVNMMKQVQGRIPAADVWIKEDGFLSNVDITLDPAEPQFENQLRAMMFQAGYLTINQVRMVDKTRLFNVTVPNDEVKNSLLPATWQSFVGKEATLVTLNEMAQALNSNNLELFFNILNAELNNIIPWKAAQNAAKYEGYYQSLLLILLRQVKEIDVSAEIQNISGQLDIRIVTNSLFFVFEAKQHACASTQDVEAVLKSAVNQVFDKNYVLGDKAAINHECYAVGLVFSSVSRLAAAFQVQKFEEQANKIVRNGAAQNVVYLTGMQASKTRQGKRTLKQASQDSGAEAPSKKKK
jgi:hypothetical protein